MAWIKTRRLDRETAARSENFGLVWNFRQKNVWPVLLWNVGQSAQLHRNAQKFFLDKTSQDSRLPWVLLLTGWRITPHGKAHPRLVKVQILDKIHRQGKVASTISRLESMWFLFVGLFKVGGLLSIATHFGWIEGKRRARNKKDNTRKIKISFFKFQKTMWTDYECQRRPYWK